MSKIKKNLQFSIGCEKFHYGRSYGFLLINICNHGEHYETPCILAPIWVEIILKFFLESQRLSHINVDCLCKKCPSVMQMSAADACRDIYSANSCPYQIIPYIGCCASYLLNVILQMLLHSLQMCNFCFHLKCGFLFK